MPQILKESHGCHWFRVTRALCPSCQLPELPDHCLITVLGLQCLFCSQLKGEGMFSSISWASRLPQAGAGEGGHAVAGAGVKGAGGEAWESSSCASAVKPSSGREGKALSTVRSCHLLSNAKIWQEWNTQEPLVLTDWSRQQEKMLGHLLGFPCLWGNGSPPL